MSGTIVDNPNRSSLRFRDEITYYIPPLPARSPGEREGRPSRYFLLLINKPALIPSDVLSCLVSPTAFDPAGVCTVLGAHAVQAFATLTKSDEYIEGG